MQFNCNELRGKVSGYCSHKLLKQELGKWALEAYYDLLRGGYLETEKVALYPFLKTLSQIHIPCLEKDDIYPSKETDIYEIIKILSGEKPFSFCLKAGIPIQAEKLFADAKALNWEQRKIFHIVYDRLKTSSDINKSLAAFSIPSNYSNCAQSPNTILEILEAKIFDLIQSFHNIHSFNNSLNAELCLYGYSNESNANLSVIKLLEYLECYLGYRNFLILVSFFDGIPTVSLLV